MAFRIKIPISCNLWRLKNWKKKDKITFENYFNCCSLRSQFSKDWHTWHGFAETSPTFLQGLLSKGSRAFWPLLLQQHFRTSSKHSCQFCKSTEFLKSCSTRQSMLCYWHYFCCLLWKRKYIPSFQKCHAKNYVHVPVSGWMVRISDFGSELSKIKRFFSQRIKIRISASLGFVLNVWG